MRRRLHASPAGSSLRGVRAFAVLASASTIAAGLAAFPSTAAHAATSVTFLKTLAGPPAHPAAMYPSGLAWDANSNRLVVADTGNDRVSVFDSGGNLQFSFGSFGTGNGQFDTPREVAIDGASNIYVADAGNNRVQKFDATGAWQWTSGGIGTCSTCLNTPIGISFDATNNVVLVADTGQSLIKAFSPSDGTSAWPSPSPRGIMASPREAKRGPDGRIWVADYHNQEVKAFNVTPSGTWTSTPAITLGDGKTGGHLLGELNFPYNVGFSLNGKTIYVADTGNERIAIWDLSKTPPAPMAPFGSRCTTSCPAVFPNVTPAAQFQQLRRVTIDTAGNIWAADFWGSGIHEFDPSGTPLTEIDGYNSSAPGFEQAFGVAVGTDGTTYGVDRLDQRIEEFDPSGNFLGMSGQRGVAPGSESWPEDAAVAPDGTVWMADTRNDRLQHYPADLSGTPSIVGGTQGSALGQFNFIEGVTVAANGVVYVADSANNRIQSYNPSNQVFTGFGSGGSGNGQLQNPEGVAVSSTDMYVADTLNNRIEELDLNGNYVGQSALVLNQPQGVALAPDGTLWVADSMNNRIVHLSSTLTDLGDTFGSLGTTNMQFFDPHSLTVNAAGTVLYVADTFNNRIQEFSLGGVTVGPAAKLAFTQEPSGSTQGTPFATQPSVAVEDASGNLVTTDSSSVALAITLGSGTGGANLSCTGGDTMTASSGVATFSGCAIDTAGTGYSLTASDGSLTSAVSNTFDITNPASTPTWEKNIFNAGGVAPLYPAAGVADGSGNRYVADSGGSRIVKIDSGGIQTTVSTAVADPRSIVWDSAGAGTNLWVASTSNNTIVEMTTAGVTLATLGGTGSLKNPYGVADDSTGVYVADTYNMRVVKLNKSTGAQLWVQTTCSGKALKRPRGLGVGSDGNVYVTDTDNSRIAELNPSTGACIKAFGAKGSGHGQFSSPWTLLSDGAGGLWVADAMNFRVEHVTNTGTYISTTGSFGTGNGQFRAPHGLFLDGGLLDVADPYVYSIQRFTIAGGALTYSSTLGGIQPAAGGFNGAFAAVYDHSGNLYVVDWFNDRVEKFDSNGNFLLQWGGYGSKPGSFIFPRGIAITADGNTVVVTNSEDNRIDLFTTGGVFVKSVKPSSGTPLSRPHQTALASDGSYWVADTLNNRIVHLSATGAVLSTFNHGGALSGPQGIAIDAEGNLYVSDAGNNAVEKYNQSGTLLATLATNGSGPTNVSNPFAITVTGSPGSEVLLIGDSGNNRILELTTSGAAVLSFGTLGSGNGQMSSPRGAAVNPVTGEIAVSDFSNNRVSIWS